MYLKHLGHYMAYNIYVEHRYLRLMKSLNVSFSRLQISECSQRVEKR